ncbi:MAG: hypothetical protein ACI8PB_004914 [Desulforhopalus sp.]|jgi:hypothetical protein
MKSDFSFSYLFFSRHGIYYRIRKGLMTRTGIDKSNTLKRGQTVSNYIHLTDDDKTALTKLVENIIYETIDDTKIVKRVKW